MALYKLKSVRYSTKKEKLRIQNGRSDVVLELNSGFMNFRQLLNLVADEVLLWSHLRFAIRIEYIDQQLSYYIETPMDIGDSLDCSGSSWEKVDRCNRSWSEHETRYGSYHINVADGVNVNPIDDIVSSNKYIDFVIEIDLTTCLWPVTNYIQTELSEYIIKLSQEKQENRKKHTLPPIISSIVDWEGASQTKVFVDKEWMYNYLYDLFYLLSQSSTHFLRPAISIYTNHKYGLARISSSIWSGSRKRGVNTNINYLFREFTWELDDKLGKLDYEAQKEIPERMGKLSDAFFEFNMLFGCITNSDFVSALFAFPQTKIPGIDYIEEINYGTMGDAMKLPGEYRLGTLFHHYQTHLPVTINPDDLVKHTLVTGVTGSGKTTTIKSLLMAMYENKKPFLVLEPAKTEYKDLNIGGLRRYVLGIETENCLKINPFEFPYKKGVNGFHLQTHLDLLKSIFIAAFPMYGPMPYVLENAFYYIYQWYGWDFKSGHNIYWDDASVDNSELFPTLDDLYNAIDHIVSIQGYSIDFQNDLTAALKVRVGSLKSGAKGVMLNTKYGTGIGELLSCPTVVELERIGDAQEKVFIMGLLLVSIYEYYIAKGAESEAKLRHLLVIEEAHRLLENVQQINNNEIADMKGKAIETFNHILSEIRAYGQGIVVADQIPTKISPDVVKNTNLKIIHRLFSLDDRNAVGDAIGLDYKQKKGLINLDVGEAIVFHAKLLEAVKVKVDSRGKEKGSLTQTVEPKELNTLDVVVSTTAIYSETKKVFQTALVFDWGFPKLKEKLERILRRFSIEPDEKLIGQLVSNLVEWFAIRLRNNKLVPYSLPKENEIKTLSKSPEEAIKGLRAFINTNSHMVQFPATLKKISVGALDYFIYVYTEDRKTVSNIVTSIMNARVEKFRYYDVETQSTIIEECSAEKYFCTGDLSEDEIMELCQCIVYFCSYPHTGFEYYFEDSISVSDDEYMEYLELPEENKPANISVITRPIDRNTKELLESISNNLKEIGQKQQVDPNMKGVLRLPIVLMLINSLFIIMAVLYLIFR
jgi:DNA helicase HerA-like ATPase